ncbi:hypothetical protein BG000_001347 [Podila horticola]|nr:hypothetical protein BG000_001347 [Podila horticola]
MDAIVVDLATAVKCLSPAENSTFFTGQDFTVAWSVSFTDDYIYDSIDAQLYCLDGDGVQAQWRSLSTLFSARNITYPQGQFQSRLPNCGPVAKMGAVRITMSGFYGVFQTGDDCMFNILSTNRLTPEIVIPSVTSSSSPSSSTLNKGNSPSPTTSIPTEPTSNPIIFTGGTTVPTATNPSTVPVFSSGFQSSPTTLSTGTSIPPSASSSSTSSTSENVTLGPNAQTTSVIPVPSGLPVHPPLPPYGSTGTEGAKSDSAKTIGAVIGTVGMAAALAVVVVSLMLVRRRRRRRMAGEGSTSSLGPSTGGRSGRVMKEKKRKGPGLWGGRHSSNESGGHFVQMDSSEDEDDRDSSHGQDAGVVPRLHAVAGGVGVNAAGKSEISEVEKDVVVRERGEASIATPTATAKGSGPSFVETTVAMPPHVFMDPAVLNRRRYSSPMTESSAYSMSSIGSSFVASSVLRQYWAASEAARAERRRDTYGGRSLAEAEGYYTEGSIFGDRDSESRMADIVSRTENGSVGTFTTQRQRDHSLERRWARGLDRRNTLGSSIGDSSSLQRTTTMTMSFSSIPSSMDSEEYHEQVYLDQLHMQGLRMREQELMMLHEHRMRQQEYYDHRPQFHHHPHDPHLLHHGHHHYPHHADYIGTMTSRRSSSVPSLTSTNDPFKTFDSNDLLATPSMDPFSDSRAVTPIQLDMDDSLPSM